MTFIKPTVVQIKIPGMQGPSGTGGTGTSTPTTVDTLGGAGTTGKAVAKSETQADGRTALAAVSTTDSRLSDSRTPRAHTHPISEVVDLTTALAGKQAAGSYVTTTDTRLTDARTPTAHTHTSTQVSDFTEAVQDAVAALITAGSHTGISWTYNDTGNTLSATVTATGSGATTDPEIVRDTIAAALRGTGITINHDDANDTITLVAAVTSVAGRTGNVTLTKTDVGLASVDNTSDAAKPVSTAQQLALDDKAPLASPTFTGTVSGVTKAHVGLGSVDNTSDAAKPVSTATQTALNGKANSTHTHTSTQISDFTEATQDAVGALLAAGTHSGITFNYDDTGNRISATVTASGGSTQELSNVVAGSGINIVEDTVNKTLTFSAAITSVAGRTGAVVLSKSDVGLANVDNTSDTAKPVSTATQTALNLKANLASPTFTGTVSGVTKAHVGLGNVDNTSDVAKPVSTATQTALEAKAPLASPTFTGTVSGVTKTHVGLANVDNTSDAAKPVSTATQSVLDTKANRVLSKQSIAANYTLVSTDAIDRIVHSTSATAITITLPSGFAQEIAIPWRQAGAGQITFAPGTGMTLVSRGNVTKSAGQWAGGVITCIDAITWLLEGDVV